MEERSSAPRYVYSHKVCSDCGVEEHCGRLDTRVVRKVNISVLFTEILIDDTNTVLESTVHDTLEEDLPPNAEATKEKGL